MSRLDNPQQAPDSRFSPTSPRWESICREYQPPLASPGLADAIMAKRRRRSKQRSIWQIAASIAVALPLLAYLTFVSSNKLGMVTAQRFSAINQPQRLQFVVTAKQAHDKVRFSLQAPKQWTFYGYRDSQFLTWEGQLKAGSNLLNIPLVAHQAVSGTLVVTIRHNDEVKEYRIALDVNRQPA